MKLLLRVALLVSLVSPMAAAQVANVIDPGVTRFDASQQALENALPSLSFEDPSRRSAFLRLAPMHDWATRVKFFESQDGRHAARLDIEPGTSLYGTGEVSGRLLRNGRVIECWNTDAYGYGDDSPSLYQSHPWVLAVRADGSAYGVLADTTYRCRVDLQGKIEFAAEGREFPVILFEGDSPQQVITRLTDFIGRITLPPKWALGYHQCRYSYYPDARVREIATTFREKQIPCDIIWMDIDYMDGFRCFTWDPEHFPNPSDTNAFLHSLNFKSVWMIDPGIKNEDGYFVHDQGDAADVWVQRADGSEYTGHVWPGECVFPDYLNADVRTWWAGLYDDFMATGIDGVWNDMNEPAVFNVASKTMPEDNHHRADPELGGPGPHARYHNVYGMFMVKASREGIMEANPEKRPFVLSRASFIGGHRYGAMWTGDNLADWYHLESSVPMAINMGLSGQPFAGPDIGGFGGNGTAELFARWMGMGAFMPFSRGHTGKGNIDKEPWSFGPEVEETSRIALETRYKLMPYFYTLFREATVNGLPVIRPLFFADPANPALRSEDDSFLLGSGLLVEPALTPQRDRALVRPAGIWNRLPLHDPHPDIPELFVKGGSIVTSGPLTQYVDEKPLNPLTLWVSLDGDGRAEGELYEDEGDGWGYRDGTYLLTSYEARTEGENIVVSVRDSEGQMPRPERMVEVVVLMGNRELRGSGPDGSTIKIEIP